MIWGKTLGAIFGFLIFNLPGALLGIWLGHQFDRGISTNHFGYARDPEQVKISFFTTVFKVMGHLAKADGRVSENEIQNANAVMAHMRLTEARRKQAIEHFSQGKQASFNLDACLSEFADTIGNDVSLIQMFLEIQISSAFADGSIQPEERRVLERIATRLNVSQMRLNLIINSVQAQHRFYQQQRQYQSSNQSSKVSLEDAYQVLCVSTTASDAEVKKAYRKMMSQHHPDKLAAKGLPDDMIEVAKEKTQEIQSAWELIKNHRGIKK